MSHPVIDSLNEYFSSYVEDHGQPPEELFLSRKDLEKYSDEVIQMNVRAHGFPWIFDFPVFKGVPIRVIGSIDNRTGVRYTKPK